MKIVKKGECQPPAPSLDPSRKISSKGHSLVFNGQRKNPNTQGSLQLLPKALYINDFAGHFTFHSTKLMGAFKQPMYI